VNLEKRNDISIMDINTDERAPQTSEQWSALLRECIVRRGIQHVFEVAELLKECRASVPRGEWLPTLAGAGLDEGFARRHRKILKNKALANTAMWPHLPPSYKALYELAPLDIDQIEHLKDTGEIHPSLTVDEAHKLAKQVHLTSVRPQCTAEARGVDLVQGDLRDILPTLPDGSVHLFMCDLPYKREFEDLYPPLAAQAARLLVPGGSLVALHGQYQLPFVLNTLSEHLTFHWQCAKGHKNNLKKLHGFKVASSMTPALWFVKGDHPVVHGLYPMDLLHCDEDHRWHVWGQDVKWFEHWISSLTKPGDLVVDPTCGAGTALVAAANCGRGAIGIDMYKESIEATRRRLNDPHTEVRAVNKVPGCHFP
jgi:site-specific DNA-methyltransferase (adenine-specific)